MVKEQNVQHSITSLQCADGSFTETDDQIAQEVISFYENLIGSPNENLNPIELNIVKAGPCLTDEQKQSLILPVTPEEIRTALFDISKLKAPGPDGYGSGFFTAAWDIVQQDVISAVTDFFVTGKLLKQVNATRVSLIPKKDCPVVVGDYRPIACCNTIYKIISKVLTTRLSQVLSSIVSDNQSAFLSNRAISDNIMLTQDLVRDYHRKGGGPRCLMKLDIQKTYDSVDWNFLKQIMIGLNFPDKFISWIFVCLSTVRVSFMINGQSQGFIQAKRGLRQGDPISPLLFLLAIEYFLALCLI